MTIPRARQGQRFPYEGREVTASELHFELPCYSTDWLLTALRNKCKCRDDLTRWEAQQRQKHLAGSRRGRQNAGDVL